VLASADSPVTIAAAAMTKFPPDLDRPPDLSGEKPSLRDTWMRPLYWFAGARWETLRRCEPAERERIAVIGSTVLVPTTMSFLGMLFYTKSRFHEPPWPECVGIALAWAFVIMNTDRILIATYRPVSVMAPAVHAGDFSASRSRRWSAWPSRFRFASINSSPPSGIATRRSIRPCSASSARRKAACARKTKRRIVLRAMPSTAQLPALQDAITNVEIYADQKMETERQRLTDPNFVPPASPATRAVLAQIDAAKENLTKTKADIEEKQDLHRRLVEATAREVLGEPNEFFPEPKKKGEGPRTKGHAAP